jgi:heptaprenyl diphosphate synthase
VIGMQQIQTIMTDMKDIIIQKISLSYLQQFIQNPIIDEDKLLLLISMLDHHGLSKLEMEDFVVTPMLVQVALDTHEYVSNSSTKMENETSLKLRQLTVLGGIYYSSLYYKILADTNNLAMIRALADGIKDINENKILIYQKDLDGIEKVMNSIMIIESSLINKIADYLNENGWKEVAIHFLFIKRLLLEKKTFIQEGSSLLFEALRKIVFPKYNLQSELSSEQKKYLLIICDKYIDFSSKIIEVGIRKIPSINENIKKRWSNLLHQHDPIAKTYVEEG